MAILAKNEVKAKLEAIAQELAELEAQGVKLAPNISPESLLHAESNGLVMDLETGRVTGNARQQYTVTAKGQKLALVKGA